MSMSEISFAILIACLGIATNGGILIFSRMLGAMPKRKKYSFGGYSTDETYTDHRTQRKESIDSSAPRRVSEPSSRCLSSKKSALLSPNPDVSLPRLSSLLSINRLEQDPYPSQRCSKPNGKTAWRSQSRRHKVYLQGLLILASSNLITAFTLLSSALYSIYGKEANIASVVTSSILVDTFQAVEVGAILWIAVNRAYAIHSTSRHSSRKTTANESGRPFTHTFNVTTENHMSSCLGCCCCFCYSSRRSQNVVTNVDLEVATRGIIQPPSRCLVVMRFQRISRLCLCSLPLIVLLLAFCGSIWPWLYPKGEIDPNSELELYYYTLSTSIGVFAGLFVMPTSFLLSTNCLIYRKVAKRHKRFLLRQTSNSSKITFLIDEETASSPSFNKTEFSRPRFQTQSSIPTFTITGSSDQNLNRPLDERNTQLWDVPETSNEYLPVPNENNATPPVDYLSFLSVKSVGETLTRTASSIDCSTNTACGIDNPKRKLTCPDLGGNERRRKSMSELYQPIILMTQQTRNDYIHDSVFMRQLQRQHKRTVVVLASILIVFVVCHGPRAICLCARWLRSDFGYHLLPVVTLWSRVCIFIDPVLYGFWGNRAYRRCLRNLSSHLIPVCGERGLKNQI
nr:7TM GPCR rhodopsin [Hymenolepis microstoma]